MDANDSIINIRDLVKIRTAADLSGFTVSWINQLAYKGRLTVVEIDGVRFVRRADVERIKEESQTPVAA